MALTASRAGPFLLQPLLCGIGGGSSNSLGLFAVSTDASRRLALGFGSAARGWASYSSGSSPTSTSPSNPFPSHDHDGTAGTHGDAGEYSCSAHGSAADPYKNLGCSNLRGADSWQNPYLPKRLILVRHGESEGNVDGP